jgi:hypothetical protein
MKSLVYTLGPQQLSVLSSVFGIHHAFQWLESQVFLNVAPNKKD